MRYTKTDFRRFGHSIICHVIVTAVLGDIVDTQQAAQTNAENMMKELVEKVGQLPGKLST